MESSVSPVKRRRPYVVYHHLKQRHMSNCVCGNKRLRLHVCVRLISDPFARPCTRPPNRWRFNEFARDFRFPPPRNQGRNDRKRPDAANSRADFSLPAQVRATTPSFRGYVADEGSDPSPLTSLPFSQSLGHLGMDGRTEGGDADRSRMLTWQPGSPASR